MEKPNPYLLDVLYRAGAFPFDDFAMEDGGSASIWVLPRTLNWPVVIAIRGNGVSTVAVIKELHRMAQAFSVHHAAPDLTTLSTGERTEWTYQIEFHCSGTVSRVLDRTIISRSPEELSGMLNAWIFVPWFQPWSDPKYTASYPVGGKVFDGYELPPLDSSEVDGDTHYEWDKLPSPDTGAEFDLPLPPDVAAALEQPFATADLDQDDPEWVRELDEDEAMVPRPPEAALAHLDNFVGEDEPVDQYMMTRKGRRWQIVDLDGNVYDDAEGAGYLKRDAQGLLSTLNDTSEQTEDGDEDEDEDWEGA